MRAERDPIMYEPEEEARRSPWRLVAVIVIILASAAVVFETGFIDTITETINARLQGFSATELAPAGLRPRDEGEVIEVLDALPEVEVAETVADDNTDNAIEELVADSASASVDELQDAEGAATADADAAPDSDIPEPLSALLPQPVDFSLLPAPSLLLSFGAEGSEAPPIGAVTIREDGEHATVDLVRSGDLTRPFTVQFVETQFSGNQSSWEAGQYSLENEGLLTFDIGQPRARIVISMRSNPVREPDRDVTLSVRNATEPETELAIVKLTLEDDDQRAFEEGLPSNTVGFAVNQVSVRESDPAVQVDVIRYNPDDTALEVSYVLTDVTATEGLDYFSPGLTFVYFGPGQRTARILIPLGQDARVEQDEAFILELEALPAPANSDIFSQIAVMIRDDDS
jgi:hypothetical protein